MLDISFIREHKELIEEASRKRGMKLEIDKLIELDEKRRELQQSVDRKRAEQNEATRVIATTKDQNEKDFLIRDMQKLKGLLQKDEGELKEVMKEWHALMLEIPNIPDMSVPEGKSEEDNVELTTWGEKRNFTFEVKDHITLMQDLGMADFERGSKVHGFRGYFLRGDGARLSWAMWQHAYDFFSEKGYEFFLPPAIVRKEYFYGTGHLPTDADDLYMTQDEDYLSGTAEVPLMAYHAKEILDKSELPKKYLAFSPCYRREAGSYGKDTKGLIRVHEFFKFEQLIFCEASHSESEKLHEELTKNHEDFIQTLNIPYRRLVICTGDLKKSQVKSYDTELWVPSQKAYREIGSSSYYHDFQTRRFNTRYRDGDKMLYTHSLNATAIATPRVLVALVENYQNEDGSITIPDVLQKYMGKERISKK